MDITIIKEYKQIKLKAESLRSQADFLSRSTMLDDIRRNLLDQAAECEAQCKAADEFIQRLPEPKRSIICLSYCKGMKAADVAVELNMDYRNMRYQKSMALKMLEGM